MELPGSPPQPWLEQIVDGLIALAGMQSLFQ